MPGAELGQLTRMTQQSDQQPALERLRDQRELFDHLSDFQEGLTAAPLVLPRLQEVLRAAQPAFEAGFAYSASMWQGELQVTLHWGSAELGSCSPVDPASYSDTCAHLLAGLLGIPLLEGGQADEAEPAAGIEPNAAATAATPEPEPEAVQADELEDEEFDEPGDPEPSADIHRALSDQEKASAVDMVKAMPPDRRRAFTKTFREVFSIPAEAKQIAPFFTELQHLHFIDRYTVEASGGIAA